MFSILVSADGTAWETDQLMRMRKERFKEYSDSESESISPDNPETLKSLKGTPALLMYEVGANGPNIDVVKFGYLKDLRVAGYELAFRFLDEGTFPRSVIKAFASRIGLGSLEDSRTHWAVKDGHLPSALLALLQQSYDVVFSFAGEERPYVQQVANYLKGNGVKVFYDDFEEVALWGKDLAEHFGHVYRRSGRYRVLFLSEDYARKSWTQHERRFAIARALEERAEYILPVRFDDTEIPGLAPTVKFITLTDKAPEQLAELILQKLGKYSTLDRGPTPFAGVTQGIRDTAIASHRRLNQVSMTPARPLTIFLPTDGSQVPRQTLVRGALADTTMNIGVIVHPESHIHYWVQPPVSVENTGLWHAAVYVGSANDLDAGAMFEMMAVAGKRLDLHVGQTLTGWPRSELQSQIVRVYRAPP